MLKLLPTVFLTVFDFCRFIAYFTNFYNLSNHVGDPIFADVPYARLGTLRDSEINGGDAPYRRGICDFHSGNCHSMALACHYSNPTEMKAITDLVRQENPSDFKPAEDVCTDCNQAKSKSDKGTIIDIVTLVRNATNTRAQERVIGSERSVRSFSSISESNTPDPSCSKPLNLTFARTIVSTCNSDQLVSPGTWLIDKLRGQYSKSAGGDLPQWLCEQRRLIKGVSRLLLQYKPRSGSIELPDFLILLTDTTYFNVRVFRDMVRNIENGVKATTGVAYNPSSAVGVAGCMKSYGLSSGIKFRVPALDFSIIFNRAAVKDLLKPIHCNQDRNPVCNVIDDSQVGERDVFKDGMTAVDLMDAIVSTNMQEDFSHWIIGMCFEAEW